MQNHCLLKLTDTVFSIGKCNTDYSTKTFNQVSQMEFSETNVTWSEVAFLSELRSCMGASVCRNCRELKKVYAVTAVSFNSSIFTIDVKATKDGN